MAYYHNVVFGLLFDHIAKDFLKLHKIRLNLWLKIEKKNCTNLIGILT